MPRTLTEEQIEQIKTLNREEGLIQAIKVFREMTGCGLADAKRAVENLVEGRPWEGGIAPGDENRIADVEGALARGQKIEAIKIYREMTGASLREAKEAVEAMPVERKASSGSERSNDRAHSKATSSGCGSMIVLFLCLLGGIAAWSYWA